MSLLLLMGDSTPSIGSLFSSGEAGLALDVETAYLRGWVFQDSAGATVSAAAGDPVGLILDTSRGGLDSLGSDLVSNGTFATDTVWSKGANWTIGSGVATKTGGAANNLTQTITSTAGLWYRITMDVTRTAGELTVSLGTSGTTRVINASGSYTFFILAGSSTQTLTLAGDSSFAGTVDNVTARLVPGNHAYQTNGSHRPALARTPDGGRRNLLTYSEDLTQTAWLKSNTTISANSATAPDGTATADKVIEGSGSNFYRVRNQSFSASQVMCHSVYAKAAGRNWINLYDDGTGYGAWFDLANGVLGTVDSGVTATITSAGNGWYRCTVSKLSISSITAIYLTDANNVFTYTGDGASGVLLWGAQQETGSSATAYQKVGLTSDVTESGKRDCWGLLFDGSDDSLQTASVDFSATDKMTVMLGVRRLTTSLGMITELTTAANSTNGSFYIYNSTSEKYQISFRGTSQSLLDSDAISPPNTKVITIAADISTPIIKLRINSTETTSGSSLGTGNFANAAIYIGSRAGNDLRFNGLIYTLIVRGATTPTGTIADFEKNLLRIRAGLGPF